VASNPKLPVGTVTFLFTDIEGSTAIGEVLGPDRFGDVLARHRELLRAAVEPGGGIEVLSIGDGLFCVFTSAPMAVAAAVAAQRAIAAEPWPDEAPIRVRMGLHTGEGWLDPDGSYVGLDVNRAARIGAAGHGGQVLLSDATRSVVAERLPTGVRLRDLGEHRLKDLQPQRLLDVVIDELSSDFPPIRSLDARPNNLPTQLTSFVGRERELAEVLDLLGRTRLLTLTGPGGTGKTRLSLQLAASAADRFADGVFFVALEPVRERSLVAPTIGAVFGLVETPGTSAEAQLAAHLANREVLLVLDNFEQVVDAGPIVAELLRAAPRIRVVVTSRAPLRVSGEQEYPVPGMPTPPDLADLSVLARENLPAGLRAPGPEPEMLERYEAVRLFVARASAVRPDFRLTRENATVVAAICARLQGMPLAIELATARLRLLSPDAILIRLAQQLDLLAAGARDLPDRQRTLRGAIAWSYDLLDDDLRRLLDRLSVFVGGFGLPAAEAVGGDPGIDVLGGLEALVDQSLVLTEMGTAEPRFRLLDTIREYAAEMLDARGEAGEIERRHGATFLAIVRTALAELSGTEQRAWLDRLDADHANLRAALVRATERGDRETALDLGFLLWRFWQKRGHLNEARQRLEALEADPRMAGDATRWARLQEALGGVAYWQGRRADAERHYDAALGHWEVSGDPLEIANALYNRSFADVIGIADDGGRTLDPSELAEIEAATRQRLAKALELYRSNGDRHGEANVLWAIGTGEYFLERLEEAEATFVEARESFAATGDRTMEAWALHMLGSTLLKRGKADEARAALQIALRIFHDAGDTAGITLLLDDLSAVAVASGDAPAGARLRGAARRLEAETGTQLAGLIEDRFETGSRPAVRKAMSADDLARFAAEGAAMTLDEAVAYALGVALADLGDDHAHPTGVSSAS
jgi:predicted ATPase/class 3 adenylate cyclase